MSKKLKFENMAVLIEFLVGGGLAILFHWVLDYKEAAFIIFGIGILLSLATYLLREDMAKVREGLIEHYRQSHELTFALARITDPECQAKAAEILNGTKKTINILQEGYVPLSETEFYLEAARAMDHAGVQVKTVDPLTVGWESRSALLNLYQANLRAMERGVKVMRIFVTGREESTSPEVQRILAAQLRDGVDLRLAYRDELPAAGDNSWPGSLSYNFTVYDDHLVTDVFATPGHYFGRKTTQSSEISKHLRILDIIEHNACRLTLEGDQIVISGRTQVPD